jgi:hypothetical protein
LSFTSPWTQNSQMGGEKFKVIGLDFFIYMEGTHLKEKN